MSNQGNIVCYHDNINSFGIRHKIILTHLLLRFYDPFMSYTEGRAKTGKILFQNTYLTSFSDLFSYKTKAPVRGNYEETPQDRGRVVRLRNIYLALLRRLPLTTMSDAILYNHKNYRNHMDELLALAKRGMAERKPATNLLFNKNVILFHHNMITISLL